MSHIKGTVLISTIKFTKEKFGEQELDNTLSQINPENKKHITNPVLASQWYPFECLVDIQDTLEKRHPEIDNIHFEIGRYSADQSLNSFYKIFIKVGNLSFTMSKASTMWNLFCDVGSMDVLEKGKKHVLVSVTGFPDLHMHFNNRMLGFMARMGEISGEKVTVQEIRNVSSTGCDFYYEWE